MIVCMKSFLHINQYHKDHYQVLLELCREENRDWFPVEFKPQKPEWHLSKWLLLEINF